MNIIVSILLSIIGVYLMVIGSISLNNGCYHDNHNIKFGNCKNFFNVDVLILNKEHYIDDIIFGTHNVNCNIVGSYMHNNKSYECDIITNKNYGACGEYIHKIYSNGTIHSVYSKSDTMTKCYEKINIENNGLFGFFSTLIGAILFVIPTAYMLVTVVKKHIIDTLRRRDSNVVEIQLSNAFSIEDTGYNRLDTEDSLDDKSIHGIYRTGSVSSRFSI